MQCPGWSIRLRDLKKTPRKSASNCPYQMPRFSTYWSEYRQQIMNPQAGINLIDRTPQKYELLAPLRLFWSWVLFCQMPTVARRSTLINLGCFAKGAAKQSLWYLQLWLINPTAYNAVNATKEFQPISGKRTYISIFLDASWLWVFRITQSAWIPMIGGSPGLRLLAGISFGLSVTKNNGDLWLIL